MEQRQRENLIEVDGLSKTYPGAVVPAVDGLNLEVPQGTAFGLLGPNGAGKTTTISILCTLLQPTKGCATVLGYDLVRDAAQVRRSIGLVPQDIALYPALSARENLRFFARMLRIPGGQIEARIEACLEMVGLTAAADQKIATFSGGMKRRANFAAGILHEPELLFLDEPTVGIDAQSRHLILERLTELNRAGMTLVYTTHYMEEVQQLCDQIAVVDSGRIIASGNPQQLIADRDDCSNLEDLFLCLTGKQLRD